MTFLIYFTQILTAYNLTKDGDVSCRVHSRIKKNVHRSGVVMHSSYITNETKFVERTILLKLYNFSISFCQIYAITSAQVVKKSTIFNCNKADSLVLSELLPIDFYLLRIILIVCINSKLPCPFRYKVNI